MLLRANATDRCQECGGQILSGDWKSLVKLPISGKPVGSYHTLCSPIAEDRVSPENLPTFASIAPENPLGNVNRRFTDGGAELRMRDRAFVLLLVAFTSCVIALGAFNRFSYDYYVFLRICTCLTAGVLAFLVNPGRPSKLRNILVGIAVLYNPIIPIHLTRGIWFPINMISIVILLVSLYSALLPRRPLS